ncbi:MAG: hypothetical protein HFG41_05490 [Coprococcus sp.]|nr:hypothetical protein [Coprococcus sp.]
MGEGEGRRKRRIRKRTIYGIILWVMLLSFLMIGFLLLFQVRKIEIRGNEYLSSQEIADWLEEDELSTNAVYLMWKFHFTDYALLPAMEEVKVSLRSPWIVRVTVTEKRIAGYIIVEDDFVYFDKDGVVLARTREWWDDILCIEGLSVDQVTLYEELPVSEQNKEAFTYLLDMNMLLKKYELNPERIVCQGSVIHLYIGNKCIILGDDDPRERIAQIPPILEKLGEQAGTLHLENYGGGNTTTRFEKDVFPPDPASSEDGGQEDGNQEDGDGSEDVQDGEDAENGEGEEGQEDGEGE